MRIRWGYDGSLILSRKSLLGRLALKIPLWLPVIVESARIEANTADWLFVKLKGGRNEE